MKKLKIICNFKVCMFLFACAIGSPAHTLVLEDLIKAGTLESTLQGKKIGYYLGSFDPLHKGHEAVAELPIKRMLCDYVLIYPSWGGDTWKIRADVNVRLDMLFAVFKDHPKIIVTRLNPQDLQQYLTIQDLALTVNNKKIVKPAFLGMRFIGLIGSDTALSLGANEEAASAFMSGKEVSAKYKYHTLGGCMALPVNDFIIAMRANDDLSVLNGKIWNRPISYVIESDNEQAISSTAAKKELLNRNGVSAMLSESVIKIIDKYKLYTN